MITITINSTDRSGNVDWSSLKINNRINNPDTCSFKIKRYGTKTYKPTLTKEVVVEDDGTKIFAGIIVKIRDTVNASKLQEYYVECVDYTRLLSRRLIPDTFDGKTVNYIIQYIVDNYFVSDSITYANVDCAVELDDIRFDYAKGDQCIERLAELTNYKWYIDYDKDIHFFADGDESSPFNLTDDSGSADYGKFVYNSLEIIKDDSQIKNVVYIRGGEYLGANFEEIQEADGETNNFRTAYKYKSIAAWLDSGAGYVALTIGLDAIDDPTSYDCLYNFNEKTLKFPDTSIPASTNKLKIQGDPYLPVITKMESGASQATYGKYEYKIIDKRIKTKESARELAQAELDSYMDSLVDVKFRTVESGLKAGQQISILINDRGINETCIVKNVNFKTRTSDSFYYSVELITTKSMGVIEFFQDMINKIDSGIAFADDEGEDIIIDLIKNVHEVVTCNDEVTINDTKHSLGESVVGNQVLLRANTDDPPTWVATPYHPTGDDDRKRPAFADRSNLLGS